MDILTEPAIVPDTFASGMAAAEDLQDGCFRFTFYAKQRSTYDGQSMDNVIVARLVLPVGAVHVAVRQTMQALGRNCCGGELMALRH